MRNSLTREEVEANERPGPRYTSYPTIPAWTSPFDSHQLMSRIEKLAPQTDLSLYFHLPFCVRFCHFCACTKIIDKDHQLGEPYLNALLQELRLISDLISGERCVRQVHLGGGTPTYYSPDQLIRLSKSIFEHFPLQRDAELSVEANPVVTTPQHLEALRSVGFNRLSFGVQDFDPEVQSVINREQSFEQTRDLAKYARDFEFTGLNVDLIYGLPKQTEATIQETIKKVNEIRPDRIALYSYANVPWKHPFQRRFQDSDLPSGYEKVSLYFVAREKLEDAGYQAVGMDHFALPHDELFEARRHKKLHRNFMGYTTQPNAQLLGFGLSSISMLSDVYSQNTKSLQDYIKACGEIRLDHERGLVLSNDDQIRREIIMSLMCNFEVQFSAIERNYGISFASRFERELVELKIFESQGLLKVTPQSIQVLPRGEILVRNIAMTFDNHLPAEEKDRRFSQTI